MKMYRPVMLVLGIAIAVIAGLINARDFAGQQSAMGKYILAGITSVNNR